MEKSKVSSDALPALTGRRCVGTVIEVADFLSANKVVPQNLSFCPCSLRGTRTFFVKEPLIERSFQNDQETSGKAMASLTSYSPFIPNQHNY